MNTAVCATCPPAVAPASPAAEALCRAEAAYDGQDLSISLAEAQAAWHATPCLPPAAHARAGFLVAACLYRLGRFAQLESEQLAIVDMLDAAGQTEAACQVLRWVALGVPELGSFDTGLQAARHGLKLAENAGLPRMRVLLTNALAACFERMGDPWQADRLLADALTLATAQCGDEERFVCLNNLCAVALTRHDLLRDGTDHAAAREALQRALDWGREAEVIARHLDDAFYSAYIEANLGDALNFSGEHDEAESWLESALHRTDAHRFDSLRWRVMVSLGELAVQRGMLGTGREQLESIIAAMGDQAPQVTRMRAHRALYLVCRAQGDTAAALDALERFRRLERHRGVAQLQAQAEHLVTRLEIEQSHREALAQRERANALEVAAMRDPLTGLLNRRGTERELRDMLHADGSQVVAAMIDIDHFKQVNDQFGHSTGDTVLAQFARLLREHARPQDLLGRLGGEEFLIAWSGVGLVQAAEIAERLRLAVEACEWESLTPGLKVSTSIGLAELAPAASGNSSLGEWLTEADHALYRAKRAGRNRVVAAGDGASIDAG